jgi:hypothetical protein
MSEITDDHAGLCHAALCTQPLSAGAQLRLYSVAGVNWGALWSYFLLYKAQFFGVLENALALLPNGATWVDLAKAIENVLNTTPVVPPAPPATTLE